MKAIIADDEPHLSESLCRRLKILWPQLQIAAVVHDGIAAATALTEIQPDIAFLDIRMPGKSGLEAARSASTDCQLVFVTAFDDYAVQAFEQAAADYLLKPVSDERLKLCVNRLQRQLTARPDDLLERLQLLLVPPAKSEPLRWLRVQVGNTVRMVATDEVYYFRSTEKYTTLVTRDAEFLLRTPLKDLLEKLDREYFWQIHRGTIVNVHMIISAHHDLMGRMTLRLRDRSESVTVSRSYAHLFRQM